jgi:tetratricopeptide (TPR) repeat protein
VFERKPSPRPHYSQLLRLKMLLLDVNRRSRHLSAMHAPGADPTDRAAALHSHAMELRDRGELGPARVACMRALPLFEKYSGRSHPDVANVLLELAAIEQDRGVYDRALAHTTRAAKILAPLRGDVIFDQLRVQAFSRLGDVHVARGEYRQAEKPLLRAVAIAKKKLSPVDAASAMNALGVVYKYTARFAEAGRLYRRALVLMTRALGPNDPAIATILHNLGGLEHSRGRFARGEPYARRSVAIRRGALGPDHPDVAADTAALAAILAAQGKHAEAKKLYVRALSVFERRLGKGHFEVGFNLTQLAALHQVRGELSEASHFYTRGLRILRKVLGPQHSALALPLGNLAALRIAQGRESEATTLYRESLKILRATLGDRHPDTLACARHLVPRKKPARP